MIEEYNDVQKFLDSKKVFVSPLITIILPGHRSELQTDNSDEGPTQSFPPCSGGGLSHRLSLIFVPPPQVRVHSDHSSQFPHSPPPKNYLGYINSDLKNFLEYTIK